MNQESNLQEMSRRLDLIVKLIAYQLAEGKTLTQAAPILRRIGLSASEIAAVFDTTAATVSVRLAESKRFKKKSSKQLAK